MANAEFGRTPRVNTSAARDHRPFVYSVAVTGGGVAYGPSDKAAAFTASNPHEPRDVAATLYRLLGVPPDTDVSDHAARPFLLAIDRKIDGLLL